MAKEMVVRDVMSTNIKSVSPDVSMIEVEDHFKMYHFHHLPVLSEGSLVGIISHTDFLSISEGIALVREHVTFDESKILGKVTVARIMTRNPFTVPPETPLTEVAEVFSKEKFHAIPVMDKGELVGIISHHDINYYI